MVLMMISWPQQFQSDGIEPSPSPTPVPPPLPANYYSNKRWCCGDMYHLDLSVWAYEKLAEKKWGVIGISQRDVPCWYKPKNAAKQPWWSKPTPAPYWYKAPCEYPTACNRPRAVSGSCFLPLFVTAPREGSAAGVIPPMRSRLGAGWCWAW